MDHCILNLETLFAICYQKGNNLLVNCGTFSSGFLDNSKSNLNFLKGKTEKNTFTQTDFAPFWDCLFILITIVQIWCQKLDTVHGFKFYCLTYELDSKFAMKHFFFHITSTGKYLSEALILASTNLQYDDRLSMELLSSVHENSKLRTRCVHKLFFVFVLTFRTTYVHNMFWAWNWYWEHESMNNLLSYCGLVVARISASDKYLPVMIVKSIGFNIFFL